MPIKPLTRLEIERSKKLRTYQYTVNYSKNNYNSTTPGIIEDVPRDLGLLKTVPSTTRAYQNLDVFAKPSLATSMQKTATYDHTGYNYYTIVISVSYHCHIICTGRNPAVFLVPHQPTHVENKTRILRWNWKRAWEAEQDTERKKVALDAASSLYQRNDQAQWGEGGIGFKHTSCIRESRHVLASNGPFRRVTAFILLFIIAHQFLNRDTNSSLEPHNFLQL